MVAAVVQDLNAQKQSYVQRFLQIAYPTGVVLDNSGLQSIYTFDVEGLVRIGVHFEIVTAALVAFAIQAKIHPDDPNWVTMRSTAAQYITPSGILVDASSDLTIAGVGHHWFIMNVAGLSKLRLQANSGAAATTMKIWVSGV